MSPRSHECSVCGGIMLAMKRLFIILLILVLIISIGCRTDTTAPEISDVTVSDITATSVIIAWTTNESATSQVEYGTTLFYGTTSTLNTTLETNHSVSLEGLDRNTTYHYRVKATVGSDTEWVSGDYTFTTEALDLTQLWSYGLTSIRTGEPLIEEGGEHKLDESVISYGYNLVVDKNGNVLSARATPLQNGDRLILTEDYQGDHNMREYARIFTIMAPIRDTILYHFGETTREEWLAITEILTINNIKTEDAVEISWHSILSTEQVYDYIASGEAEGSPVMRYLEEAGLELKCLAFKDFDFTNPEGSNHCEEHNIDCGSGIELP